MNVHVAAAPTNRRQRAANQDSSRHDSGGRRSESPGDYVYVSPDFYTLLYRAPEREQLPRLAAASATYELEAAEEGTAASIVMRLELETLAARGQGRLPLRRGEIHLLEGRATLDGEPISLDWDDAGLRSAWKSSALGCISLRSPSQPPPRQANGAAHWRFSVPRTPRSILRIKSPLRPGDWLLPARGSLQSRQTTGTCWRSLGPTRHST